MEMRTTASPGHDDAEEQPGTTAGGRPAASRENPEHMGLRAGSTLKTMLLPGRSTRSGTKSSLDISFHCTAERGSGVVGSLVRGTWASRTQPEERLGEVLSPDSRSYRPQEATHVVLEWLGTTKVHGLALLQVNYKAIAQQTWVGLPWFLNSSISALVTCLSPETNLIA